MISYRQASSRRAKEEGDVMNDNDNSITIGGGDTRVYVYGERGLRKL